MSEIYKYGFWFISGGLVISFIYNIVMMKKFKPGDTLHINKINQKNRKSPNNTQEYQISQEQIPETDKKRKFQIFNKNKKK